jgi:transposase
VLTFTGTMNVFLAVQPADLRKSFTGLWALAANELKEDPASGALFVFTNRRRNRVKILYADSTGLWVMTKRLEQGTFAWPRGVEVQDGKLKLQPEALALLLDGVDLRKGTLRPWYQRG